jgi:hypothetical protein
MEELTQEQLVNYISAAKDFYERVKGRGRAPTNQQIHELHGSHVACMWH